MATKQTQKIARWMIIVSALICVSALVVGILALTMKNYTIAAVMVVVIIWQLWNCKQWQRRRRL